MPSNLPPIKVIAKIDPRLADMLRETRRIKKIPLAKLKAALAYGEASKHRATMSLFMSETVDLLASAAAYYWERQ